MCLPNGHIYNKARRLWCCLIEYNILTGSILTHNLLGKIKKRNAMNIHFNAISISLAFSFNILYEASARLLKDGSFYLRGQGLHLSIERIFGDIFKLLQLGICQ